jgi:hypothetical protein
MVDACEDCLVGKARQKNFNKELKEGISTCVECLYVDIS